MLQCMKHTFDCKITQNIQIQMFLLINFSICLVILSFNVWHDTASNLTGYIHADGCQYFVLTGQPCLLI